MAAILAKTQGHKGFGYHALSIMRGTLLKLIAPFICAISMITLVRRRQTRRTSSRTSICLILTTLMLSLSAAEAIALKRSVEAKRLDEQRYHYELAKSALAKRDMAAFQTHYAHLDDYPLVAYLDYALAKENLSPLSLDQINAFILKYKDSYLAARLQRQLVHQLAKQKRWKDFIFYYSENMYSKTLKCDNLYARIQLDMNEGFSKVADLWSVGKSQPKGCDRLFKVWKDNGGLTNEIAWTRFNAAMKKGNTSLARYVKSLLSPEYLAHAELYEKVRRQPNLIRLHDLFTPSSKPVRDIISYGIKKYARKDPADALYHWELYEAQQFFDIKVAQDTKHTIVTRLTREGLSAQARALIEQSPSLRKRDVVERLIRNSLKEQNWSDVLYGIKTLPEKLQNHDRWAYWRARAESELNLENSEESAMETYRKLAKNRSFYGFLASDILESEYSFEHTLTEVAPSVENVIAQKPALVRAKELWLTGYNSEAQAEWRYGTRGMSARELEAAGVLAQKWGWYHKSINAMIAGNHWDHLTIRFPLAYEKEVRKISYEMKMEPTLIFAIARQESAFLESAKSSAGARGLMQVMPATAKETARKSGISHRTEDLYSAEHNINIGSHYLSELLTKFNGNRILAAAAYNAGPHRVTRWMSDIDSKVPYDVWIETIPFKETRGYVQNVLSFSVIYSYRLGKPSKLITPQEASRHL